MDSPSPPTLYPENEDNVEQDEDENVEGMEVDDDKSVVESSIVSLKRKDRGEDNEDEDKEDLPDIDEDDDLKLDDEDFYLLEENLGYKVKKQFKRVRRIDSSDEEDNSQKNDKEEIANELFDLSDDERDKNVEIVAKKPPARSRQVGSDSESESDDDVRDFIVDEYASGSKSKRRRRGRDSFGNDYPRHLEQEIRKAQDIFGADFVYEDIIQEDENEDGDDYDDDIGIRKTTVKTKKTEIIKFYEPAEIENKFLDKKSIEINRKDEPERYQRRSIPVLAPIDDNELDEEANWMLPYFKDECLDIDSSNKNIVAQVKEAKDNEEDWDDDAVSCMPSRNAKDHDNDEEVLIEDKIIEQEVFIDSKLEKIKTVLNLMRNDMFDIPYIALYHEGPIRPLKTVHIWKIFDLDMKYCQLKQRKQNLYKLMSQMKDFTVDSDLLEDELKIRNLIRLRPITEEDLNDVNSINSLEDLAYYQKCFSFYYGFLVPYLNENLRKKEILAADENNDEPSSIKQTRTKKFKVSSKTSCYEGGLKSFAIDFLPHFAMNFEEIRKGIMEPNNYPSFEVVKPCAIYPNELAETIIEDNHLGVESSWLLERAKHLLAEMIARDPKIKKCIREIFLEKATIDVRPTMKGESHIDELHPLYRFKYLTKKPHEAFKGDEFLHFLEAEKEKLIILTIGDGNTIKEACRRVIRKVYDTLGNEIVQAWNKERVGVVNYALEKIIFPEMQNMLKTKMKLDAHEFIIQACRQEIKERIKVGPFFFENQNKKKENSPDWSSKDGIRVMSVVFPDDNYDYPIYVTLIDQNGEYYEHLELRSFLRRPQVKLRNRDREFASEATYGLSERQTNEFNILVKMLKNFKPHVIVIGGKTYSSLRIKGEIMDLIQHTIEETSGDFPNLSVEIIATDLSQIIARSKNSYIKDNLPLYVKEGVSLARRIRDPLLEFSQLCHKDDILCLRLHPLQGSVNQELLLNAINSEFVNIINEVGVDFDKILSDPYYSNLLHFISGLGPSKAFNLLSAFKRKPAKLENRTQLVTIGGLGPLVFRNCSGFIKLNTDELYHTSDYYIEHLDSTRIIPEYYDEAREIAIAALDRDREMDNSNIIEDIFKSIDKGLDDIDLKKYASYKKDDGLEHIYNETSLALIRDELNMPFMDKRHPYVSNLAEETLNMLTNGLKIQEGKLYIGTVIGIEYNKQIPFPDLGDDELWRCQMCDVKMKDRHYMAKHVEKCLGEVKYVRVELEQGIVGILPYNKISDAKISRKVFDEMIFIDKAIYVRITRFRKSEDYLDIELTSRGSDLKDANKYFSKKQEMVDNEVDKYYDVNAEKEASKKIELMKKEAEKKNVSNLSLRKSNHPEFKNVTHQEGLQILENKPIGSIIIRPSSKGLNYLTLVLKITDTIYQYITIKEEDKPSDTEVGSKLIIGDEEFEDLNEITDNNILPITQFNEELMSHKSYCMGIDGDKIEAARTLKCRKEQDPNMSHYQYLVSASKKYPGTFLLSYLLKNHSRHEYITVSRTGYHFRGETFTSFLTLISWFKLHYAELPKFLIPPPASVVPSVMDDDALSVISRHLGKSY